MNRSPLREITEAEILQYEEDGIVRVRGMFDDEWTLRMQNAIDFILDNPGSHGTDLNSEGTSGRFAYDNYMWTFNDDFRAMTFDSPIAEIAAKAMRSESANLVFDWILVKEPHTSTRTKWHQDIPANPVEGSQVCGIWFSLDHVTPDSGAVEWIKGSHKWGTRYEAAVTGDPTRHKYLQGSNGDTETGSSADPTEPVPDIQANRDQYDIVQFETLPGDFLIASLSILHGAPGNETGARRRAFGYRFAGDDASYAVRRSSSAIKPIYDPKLRHGDPFPDDVDHHVFPRLWPRAEGRS